MSWQLDRARLEYAFEGRADLIGAVQAASTAPEWIELFNEITKHVAKIRDEARTAIASSAETAPSSKKRRLDDDNLTLNGKATAAASTGGQGAGSSAPSSARGNGVVKKETIKSEVKEEESDGDNRDPGATVLEVKEISVVVPQRKKLTIAFTETHIQAVNASTKEVVAGMSYAWKDIAYAFCLPVPEKAQKQHNYILFPTTRTIPPSRPQADSPAPPDPFIFTIPATPPKPGSFSGALAQAAAAVGDEYKTLFDWAINNGLKKANKGVTITVPDAQIFSSALQESHRPKEAAYHVRGFRGSKDGYLFFLENGIIFVFKKPIIFLPLARIQSVSYVAVLQRTFNLVVEALVGDEGDSEELEFSMLDQEDYAGIDEYVKRFGLQDTSMAEQRRAKTLGINVVKNENGEVTGVVEASELAKAGMGGDDDGHARDAAGGGDTSMAGLLGEDEDEEDDEDFDPGSGGESEGSGESSSDEDSDDDGEGGGEGDEGDEDDDE